MKYFVTAIGTDSGKTVVSAIITQMLGADYWKPIQAGEPTDTAAVRSLVTNPNSTFHKEVYRLQMPASPHDAARKEKIQINLQDFHLPKTENPLVVEGAGGALVPINDYDVVIDLAVRFELPVVVVSNLYLGSINHTLLTAEALNSRGIEVKGVVFNGDSNPESERIILMKTGWEMLLHLPTESKVDKAMIKRYANELKRNW